MGKFVSSRKFDGPVPAGRSNVPLSTAFQTRYPALTEHMSIDVWDDGKPRETTTLSLFIDQGALKACVNDRSRALVAFVTGDSVEGLLDVLERGLQNDDLDWRVKKLPFPKGRKGG